MCKKAIGIITYILGIWVWIINLLVGTVCTFLFAFGELTIKEYILSIIYIIASGIIYHYYFLYILKQKVYTYENKKDVVIFYTYKNQYIINKKDIIKQTPHILIFFSLHLHWRIVVKSGNKKQTFFVENKI